MDDAKWGELKDSVTAARPDILVTNELPFGPWLADGAAFSEDEAHLSVRAHVKGLQGLIELDLPAVISSRPVWNGKRLTNEAFVLESGVVRSLHRKQYLPNEPGWFESGWYAGDGSGFSVAEVPGGKGRCALVYGSDVQRTCKGLRKARRNAGRHLSCFGDRDRAMENRWRNGVARFRRVRRQFEPDRRLLARYPLWRRRFRLCPARTAIGGDNAGQSRADFRTRSEDARVRAAQLSLLCSRERMRKTPTRRYSQSCAVAFFYACGSPIKIGAD
jgi:hypothetical protein